MSTGAVVELRPAGIDDRDRVLEWSNDPDTRAASFHTRKIEAEEHARWYAACLRGERTLLIAEHAGTPVGMVRLDPLAASGALVSIAIGREYRGRRLAMPMLEALIEAARAQSLAGLTALVRVANTRSRRLFEKAGFDESGIEEVAGAEAVRYELCLVDTADTESGQG